ncbi:MAG: response regulator transcription factor [Winogradskyella sp.]
MNTYSVLIIDDHPQIIESFTMAFKRFSNDNQVDFKITEASTIDRAYDLITQSKKLSFDIVVLDIKLPESKIKKLLSGEDLGLEIRKHTPETKIIIATTYNDNYRINSILLSINPEGFLVKNDLTSKTILTAIDEVINDIPAYSPTVKKLLRNLTSNDFTLDQIDRQILHELSIGSKMVDLPKIIAMSIGGIERRKRRLKEIFNVYDKDDRALIEIAKEKGFI